jgi:hypothetical protein
MEISNDFVQELKYTPAYELSSYYEVLSLWQKSIRIKVAYSYARPSLTVTVIWEAACVRVVGSVPECMPLVIHICSAHADIDCDM